MLIPETSPGVAANAGAREKAQRWLLSHRRAMWLTFLLVALVSSRLALAPRYLITFDQINFALSIDEFNPALHQPQPPGYPLFAGMLKIVAAAVADIENVFLLAALMVSSVSLVLLWALAGRMGRPATGAIAASLLLFHPAFWLAALTNPVRLCLAAGATGVVLCLWTACRHNSRAWFMAAAGVLGIAAGFRPALTVTLFPILVWTAFRIRLSWRAGVLASLCLVAAVATWLPVLVTESGGLHGFVSMMQSYSEAEVRPHSLLFGGAPGDAAVMAWRAVVWSCLGVLSWIWWLPGAVRRNGFDRSAVGFLALWFVPGLLFFACVHVGDPDHTLSIVPATCIAGALTIAAATRKASLRTKAAAIGVAVLLNVFLFMKPISKTAAASTYKPVRWLDDYVRDVVDGVRTARQQGPVTVIFHEFTTGWRQLSWYEPGIRIAAVRQGDDGSPTGWDIQGRRMERLTSADGVIHVPACKMLVWVDPTVRPRAALQEVNARVTVTRGPVGEMFEFQGVRIVADGGPCERAD